MKEIEKKRWADEINGLTRIFARKGWFSNFIQRNNKRSCRAHSEAAFISEEETRKCTIELFKVLCFFDCKDIANTDKVAVLFRSLPIRTINPADVNTGRKPLENRLTVVITVFCRWTESLSGNYRATKKT